MDALSDVLRVVRLTGGVFLDAHFTAPWCVRAQVAPEDVAPMSAPAHLVAYHYVVEGALEIKVDGQPVVRLEAGQGVLLPRNDAHTLGSGEAVPAVGGGMLVQMPRAGGLAEIRHGGGGAATHIVCGFLGAEARRHPLFEALPALMPLDIRSWPAGAWMDSLLRYAPQETSTVRPGTATCLAKISELLFVEAVRRHLDALPAGRSGWLTGLRDPAIGRALSLMHAQLARSWTVDALAAEVFLSRSAFAERFTTLVGMPPLSYLVGWRMQVAMHELARGRSVAQAGSAVGYDAEAAFSRAFKREVGMAPATWRRGGAAAARAQAAAAVPA